MLMLAGVKASWLDLPAMVLVSTEEPLKVDVGGCVKAYEKLDALPR